MSDNITTFLKDILPTAAPVYCACFTKGAPHWENIVCNNIEQIVAVCSHYNNQGFDTYFALSGYSQGYYKAENSGKPVFRTQQNAAFQKCLWLDIDCGEGKAYPDMQAGIRALFSFLEKSKLPIPYVVASGFGLHVYWSFEETIPTNRWQNLAALLKQLCVHYDFKVDHARTTDAASVLRMPGTNNYKRDTPRPVQILQEAPSYSVLNIANVLVEQAQQCGGIPATPIQITGAKNFPQFEGPKRHPYRIIKECKQIQQAGVGTYSQWYNMMLVMKHCEFGERAVHDISKMDPARYNEQTVQAKYQQAIDGGYGPCRCSTFDEKDPGICPTCPYWGKIASPLLLGEPIKKSKPIEMPAVTVTRRDDVPVLETSTDTITVTPFVIEDFSVVPGKGVFWHKTEKVTKSSDGESGYVTKDYLICDTELYIHSICIDNTTRDIQRSYIVRKKPQGRAYEDIFFAVDTDFGPQNMLRWLSNNGLLPIKPIYNKPMVDFMSTYLAAVQNRLPEIYIRDHMGWANNRDKITGESYEGFIVGTSMYTERGVMPVSLNDRADTLAKQFTANGSLEEWKKVPELYKNLNQPFAQLMFLTAFGAPFMRYGVGTATNIAYNIWDVKGGRGKSNLLQAIAGVWGDPLSLLQTKNDTPASRFQKFAVMKNLPICVDEITTMRDESVADLIYDIVNGREKSRSTSSGTSLAKSGTWSTCTLFTSNTSLYELLKNYKVQSTATCMRVIELPCDFKDYTGRPEADYINDILMVARNHYGLAGPEFLKYCFAHPEVFKKITEYAQEFTRQYAKHSDERFWLYGIAIPLAAGAVAVSAGLLNYDIKALAEWCINVLLPTLRRAVRDKAPSSANILADFLNEHINNTLIVTSAVRKSDQADPGVISGIDSYVKAFPTHALYVRKELDTNTYYVSTKQFNKWCIQNGISPDVTMRELEAAQVWQKGNKYQYSLGAQVRALNHNRSMVYKFKLIDNEGDDYGMHKYLREKTAAYSESDKSS